MRFTYHWLCGGPSHQEVSWKWLRKLKALQKLKNLMLLSFLNQLRTQVLRSMVVLVNSSIFSFCGESDESMEHVLRNSGWAEEVWFSLLDGDRAASFFCGNIVTWFLC